MIGTTVRHYEIRKKLGAGGMGVVYKARDLRLDRWVALKFLSQHAIDDPLARERFIREAKAASALDHPHICPIHEIGETEDDQLYICMAYYAGPDLRTVIREGHLTTAKALEVARQIASALSRAHEVGIVHRDLKPSNIMTTPQGDVAIVDFGLAKLSGEASITKTGATLGTTAYMSPEQVRGQELDHRTDLWSLGILVYQLLTGEYPFDGDYDRAIQRAILEDDPQPPSAINPELSQHLDEVVLGLLAKDRNERISSAGEVIQLLHSSTSASLDSRMQTEMATPRTPAPSAPKRWRPNWKSAALVAAGVVTAILGWRFWPEDDRSASAQSLAVMPFSNFTGDESKSYISNGIAGGLITALSELQGLSVLSQSEAWAHRDKGFGARRLGEVLGVDTLLEGNVHGETATISVETSLIDVRTGEVVWSDDVQGSVTELKELTRQIAERLTRVLSVSVSERERRRLSRDPTQSFQAYDYYLQGQEFLADGKRPEDLESSIELFRQAIRVDPEFALAHVALSEALWQLAQRDGNASALESAREEADKALELDPELPAALVALARVQRSSGRYTDSIASLNDALVSHPDPAAAHRELSLSYERAGDLESAEDALRAACLVGSADWKNWNYLGAFLWRKGEYSEARDAFQKAITAAPEGVLQPHRNLAANEISLSNWEEAIFAFEQIPGSQLTASLASNLGTAYYFSDRPDKYAKAAEHYATAARLDPRNDGIRRNLADIYLIQGDVDRARAQYLEALRLVEEKLTSDPESWSLRLTRCFYAARAEDCGTALGEMDGLEADLPASAMAAQYSAYVFSLCGERERALDAVGKAIQRGVQPETLRKEPEFESLRDDPEFLRLTQPRS